MNVHTPDIISFTSPNTDINLDLILSKIVLLDFKNASNPLNKSAIALITLAILVVTVCFTEFQLSDITFRNFSKAGTPLSSNKLTKFVAAGNNFIPNSLVTSLKVSFRAFILFV